MFNIDGDALNITLDMDLDEVEELKTFIEPRLEYIDSIGIMGEARRFQTSALFQLLVAIKKERPEVVIPILDDGFALDDFGTFYWKTPWTANA